MRIAVIGVGGVGGYFGARLAQAGEEVTFIARGETLRALRENGLRVESVDGDMLIEPAQRPMILRRSDLSISCCWR